VQVIAHRGASRAERENTLAAFRRAAELGADAVELDVRRSIDGVLMVHHDVLPAVPAAELPADVPTLGDAIEACAGMWVNVEIKNDPGEPGFEADDGIAVDTLAVLAQFAEPQRWVISSFRLATIDRCRAIDPRVRTAWLTNEPPVGVLDVLVARGHAAWHPWVKRLDQASVRAAHARGLQVNTWTCNRPEALAEVLAWGVDGVCTDVPDVALRVRAAARGATAD
jgi:glycerophosphoryl diester phosphodiesterase